MKKAVAYCFCFFHYIFDCGYEQHCYKNRQRQRNVALLVLQLFILNLVDIFQDDRDGAIRIILKFDLIFVFIDTHRNA